MKRAGGFGEADARLNPLRSLQQCVDYRDPAALSKISLLLEKWKREVEARQQSSRWMLGTGLSRWHEGAA
jgi:hypothetical protein